MTDGRNPRPMVVGLATAQGLSTIPKRQRHHYAKGKKLHPALFLCTQRWPRATRCNFKRLWEGQVAEWG